MILRLMILIIFLIVTGNAKELEKVNLQLEWKFQFEFAGYIAAKEKGFYEDEGLDVSITQFDNTKTIDVVLDSEATYGVHNSSLVLSKMQGSPVVLISSFLKKSALVLVTKKEIKSPSDLKNRTIMAGHGQLESNNLGVLLNKFNVKIGSINVVPHTFNIEDFVEGKIDAMTAYTSNELYELKKRGIKFNILDPVNYGIFMYGGNLFTSLNELDKKPLRVEKFKNASIKGWKYALANKEEIISIIYEKYRKNKSLEALSFESKEIEKLIMPSVFDIGYVDKFVIENIANNFVELGLNSKYYSLDDFIYGHTNKNKIKDEIITLNLTQEEKKYVQNKKEITMCIDPDWLPYEKFSDGTHIGMSAEYFKQIEKLIQIPIRVISTSSWAQSLEFGKSRACDIFSLVVDTPNRRKYLNFTKPYFSFPLVVATKHNKSFVADISNIKDKKLSIVKGYAFIEILKTRFPNINLVEVSSVKNGLKLVENDLVFGHIDTLPVIGYQIQRDYTDSLKIAGKFDDKWELGIGVRNDDALMFSILNKATSIVKDEFIQEILNKWISVTIEQRVNLNFLWKYVAAFILVLFFILYKYFLTNRNNKRLLTLSNKLELSNKKYQSLLEMFDNNVIAFKINKKGHILYTSKALHKVTSYSFDDLLGINYNILQDEESNTHDKPGKEHGFSKQSKYMKKNGELFWVSQTVIAEKNEEGILIGYDVVLKDISAQKEVEKFSETLEAEISIAVEQNQKKDQLIAQQSKLAAMGEMVGAIAHQWRQPLTALSCNIQIIDLDYNEDMISQKYIDEYIKSNMELIDFMSGTIDEFRDFFRIEKVKKNFDVVNAIKSTISLVGALLADSKVELKFDNCDKYEISGYEIEFKQVILNIINNAKDEFVEKKIENALINISVKTSNKIVLIEISDNAGGIKNDVIDKIFEPYFTTKEKGKGTGMGLYMSKMIIEDNMKGKIDVHNVENGTKFTIELE